MKANKKSILIATAAMAITIATTLFVVNYTDSANAKVEYLENNVTVYNSGESNIDESLLDKSVGYEEKKEEIQDLIKLYNQFSEINTDTVAYLRIRDSNMNFPIVQQNNLCSKHNMIDNCYYLYRDIYKRSAVNKTAVSFMDANNVVGKYLKDFDQNTVIYGHTWNAAEKNGAAPRIGNTEDKQFAQLVSYNDMDWLKNHSVLELTTGEEKTYWVPQNIVYTDCVKLSNPDGFNYFKRTLNQEAVDLLKERSVTRHPEDVNVDTDKLLILSTCNYKYSNKNDVRFIVVFKNIQARDYENAVEIASNIEYIQQENSTDWK